MIRLKRYQPAMLNGARVLILEAGLGKTGHVLAELARMDSRFREGAVILVGDAVSTAQIEAIMEIKCKPVMTDFEPVLAAKDQRRDFLDRLNHYGNKGKKRRG